MTAVDVAAIRAALDKATPGPWKAHETGVFGDGKYLADLSDDGSTLEDYDNGRADADLIVLLRNNAEALLRMLDDGYCAGYDHGVEDQMDRQEAALADAERRGAVKAWDEGWKAGARDQMTGRALTENPYGRGEVSP